MQKIWIGGKGEEGESRFELPKSFLEAPIRVTVPRRLLRKDETFWKSRANYEAGVARLTRRKEASGQ